MHSNLFSIVQQTIPEDFLLNLTRILLEIVNGRKLDNDSCNVTFEFFNFFSVTLSSHRDRKSIPSTARVREVLQAGIKVLNDDKKLYTNGLYSILVDDTCKIDTSKLYDMVKSILIFIDAFIHQYCYYTMLITEMKNDVFGFLIFYVQFSDSEVRRNLLEPDENDLPPYSLRELCSETIKYMCGPVEVASLFKDAIFSLIHEQLQTAQNLKAQGNTGWWKLHEACYNVLSSNEETTMRCVISKRGSSEIVNFISTFVIPDMSSSMMLLAKGSISAFNMFIELINDNELFQLIDVMLAHVTEEGDEMLRTSNIHALTVLYEDYNDEDQTHFFATLHSRGALVFEACLDTLHVIRSTDIVNSLSLISLLIATDPLLCLNHQMKLMQKLLDVSIGDFRDQEFIVHFSKVFSKTITAGLCVEAIKVTWLPYVVRVLNNSAAESDDMQLACGVLSCLVLHAEDSFKKLLVNECFEALIDYAETSLDARNCLGIYLNNASDHLNSRKDGFGTTYQELVYNLIINLFTNSESSSDKLSFSSLCRLASGFLEQFRSTMEESSVYILLQVLLSRLKSLQAASPEAAAVTSVFVCMINADVNSTIRYLRSITYNSVDERTAFEEVLVGIQMSVKHCTSRNDTLPLYGAVACLLSYAAKPANEAYFLSIYVNVQDPNENVIWYLFKLALNKLKQHYEADGQNKREIGYQDDHEEVDDLSDDLDTDVDALIASKLLKPVVQNMLVTKTFNKYKSTLNYTENETLLDIFRKRSE